MIKYQIHIICDNIKWSTAILSIAEPANFLQRMLDENKGSGKDQFLGDPEWLFEMQYNKSPICGLLELGPVLSRAFCLH